MRVVVERVAILMVGQAVLAVVAMGVVVREIRLLVTKILMVKMERLIPAVAAAVVVAMDLVVAATAALVW